MTLFSVSFSGCSEVVFTKGYTDFSSSLSLKLHSPPPCDEVRLNTH